MKRLTNVVVVVLLVATSACSTQESTPANTESGQAAGSVAAAPAEITFRSDPETPKMGDNTFEVRVTENGTPVNDAQVSVEFFMAAMPQMNMSEMRTRAELAPAGDGMFRGTAQVMMAGNWEVTVMAIRNGQALATKKLVVTAK